MTDERHATFPSPVPSDRDLWPGELPFTAFAQFGEDALDLRVFDQDTWWVDRCGAPHRLAQMDDAYRRAVVAYLEERRDVLHACWVVRVAAQMAGDTILGRTNGDAILRGLGVERIEEVDARTWLESTSLMRRLRTLTGTGRGDS